ncbi:VWA domain-containing protein [Planctomycetota bacterium]|nr:VWA domain-containing protein [Planctomycetota bacterium]
MSETEQQQPANAGGQKASAPVHPLAALRADLAEFGTITLSHMGKKKSVSERYMPFLISLAIHIGLVISAIFAVWTTIVVVSDQQTVVPEIQLGETPGKPLKKSRDLKLEAQSLTSKRTITEIEVAQSTLSPQPITDMPMIGVSGGMSKVNPFAADLAGGSEFRTSFFGSSGNARTIVFVVDASGSLIDTLPIVLRELQKSIRKLSDRQNFTVVFFQGTNAFEVPPRGLKQGTAKHKQAVIEWIDPDAHNVVPGQQTNPLRAINIALKYNPDLVFLLSDNITGQGQFEVNQKQLIREIVRANHAGTKINTIQFLYPDPLETEIRPGTMKLIAEQTGGRFLFVKEDDI